MPPLKNDKARQKSVPGGPVEAKVLHVRPPRTGIAGPLGMERREAKGSDPLRGRVLTIMVPDSEVLPKDLEKADYKVIMRFQKM